MIKIRFLRSKKARIGVGIFVVLGMGTAIWLWTKQTQPSQTAKTTNTPIAQTSTPTITPTATSTPDATPEATKSATPVAPSPTKDPSPYTIPDPAALDVIVNKKRALSSSYVPAGLTTVGGVLLRSDAADAIQKLVQGASAANVSITYISGYRSYSTQSTVYNGYVRSDGQANADTYSARPGHSEHQTGLAVDMGAADGTCKLETCFSSTPAGIWLANHAYEYGFIIRYPSVKTSVTGYQYEPWHLRFIGTTTAQKVQQSGLTLEEYYGTGAAASY